MVAMKRSVALHDTARPMTDPTHTPSRPPLLRAAVLLLVPLIGVALGGALCAHQEDPPDPDLRTIRPPGLALPDEDATARPEPVDPREPATDPSEAAEVAFHPIEDPSGRALEPVFEKLRRIEAGEPGVKLRVIHYGDSHIAADFWSGRLRRLLQERFGDGGHGFMLPGKPWRSYRHRDVENGVSSRRHWHAERARGRRGVEDGLYGLGGVTVWSQKPGASAWVETVGGDPEAIGGRVSLFEVYYLNQPRGGELDVLIDGERVGRIATRAKRKAPGYARYEVPEGPHRLELKARGRAQARLFGVVMERAGASGVVYDSVGINGARASTTGAWDVALWQAHLAHRAPDLIVTTYGTNEAASNISGERQTQELRRTLKTMREAAPEAACLVLAPPDYARKLKRSATPSPEARERALLTNAAPDEVEYWETPDVLPELVEVERQVAAEMGCAFWDTFSAMGGRGSIDRWAREGEERRGGPDRIHLTIAGYRWVAEQIHGALMAAYAQTGAAPTP